MVFKSLCKCVVFIFAVAAGGTGFSRSPQSNSIGVTVFAVVRYRIGLSRRLIIRFDRLVVGLRYLLIGCGFERWKLRTIGSIWFRTQKWIWLDRISL